MIKLLLLMLAVSFNTLNETSSIDIKQPDLTAKVALVMDSLSTGLMRAKDYIDLDQIKDMLQNKDYAISEGVKNKVLTTLNCAKERHLAYNSILTIIDYSLPSNEKRLWIFDLKDKKLLFHTYVSHGLKSGVLVSSFFSNKNNSKASSLGVYRTDKSYYGRHGMSLALQGLETGFNDNAASRAVVLHGGWYVDEPFIKKYGRAGRSWGCPAVPSNLTDAIINTIKNQSLFVVYSPNEDWFSKSRFLNCALPADEKLIAKEDIKTTPMVQDNTPLEPILYVDRKRNNRREENDPIVVMPADSYVQTFHNQAPLSRMLRRQINNVEYIALSNDEFKSLSSAREDNQNNGYNGHFKDVYFVIPVIKMNRGYYATEMQIVPLGTIKQVIMNNSVSPNSYTVLFDKNSLVNLKSTNEFIRWLGL